MVNCDVPGFRTISTTTDGISYSPNVISGYRNFKDYLSELSDQLPTNWDIAWDHVTDRVQFVPAGGASAYGFKFGSQSMADICGFDSTIVAVGTSTVSGESAPDGVVPISSTHIAQPVPANKPTLSTFRHGRSHSQSWGSGTNYRLTVMVDWDDRERLQAGPCLSGKIRVGSYFETDAWSSSHLDGYLDAYITGEPNLEIVQGDVEKTMQAELSVLAPAAAHSSSEALPHTFWGSLARGYNLNFVLYIEGLAYRFCEVAPAGFSDGPRVTSATLIVDQSQTLTTKIDRGGGICAASGLTLGVLDPLGSLEIFEAPTVEIQIASDVAYNATTITLATDSTAFGSRGDAFLGKELIQYTGNTGPGGSPANQLQGVTRTYGPKYDYGVGTIAKFRTVTNKKRVWEGCHAQLYAQMLDPYGAPLDTVWDGTYMVQVFSGEISGLPGYDGGVWTLQCKDLIRRLTKRIGLGATAKTSPFSGSNQTQPSSGSPGVDSPNMILVRTPSSAELECEIVFKHVGGDWGSIVSTLDLADIGDFETYHQAIHLVIGEVLSITLPAPFTGGQQVIDEIGLTISGEGPFAMNEVGAVSALLSGKKKSSPTPQSDFLTVVVRPQGEDSKKVSWWSEAMAIWDNYQDTSEVSRDVFTGCDGRTTDAIVISQPVDSASTAGVWGSTGYAVLVGDGSEDGELIKYEASSTSMVPQRIALLSLERDVQGTTQNAFKPGMEVKRAERVQGNLGEIISALLESSGNNTQRGLYDSLGAGFGYSLTAADYVNDVGIYPYVDTALTKSLAMMTGLDFVLTGGHSLADLFGGTLSAYGMSLSWIRAGRLLLIGAVGVGPASQNEQYDITDADLVSGDAASVVQVASGPNEVTVRQASSKMGSGGSQFTYRILEDIAARGGTAKTFSLYGLNTSEFYFLAEALAMGMVNTSFEEVCYSFKVGPHKDWLAGQLVRVQITYPGVWDWQAGQSGIDGLGRIMEVSRSLATGETEIKVMVSGPSRAVNLCPSALVTAHDLVAQTITVTDPTIFQISDPIRCIIPGTTLVDEQLVAGISGTTITLATNFGFVPVDNVSWVTYPQATNANITIFQDGHAHIADGGKYLT